MVKVLVLGTRDWEFEPPSPYRAFLANLVDDFEVNRRLSCKPKMQHLG